MLICTAAIDQTPEPSPRDNASQQVDDVNSIGSRRTSMRLATLTPHGNTKSSSATMSTTTSTSKKKEEKYMGIGVVVDCKDDRGHWNEGRVIDVNTSARLLKIHYSGWHKRYDAWMPLSAVAAHGSRVKTATVSAQSLKLTKMRSNLFRLNPNYVERIAPSKSTSLATPPSQSRNATMNLAKKESEASAATPATSMEATPIAAPLPKTRSRVSPRTMIEAIANESRSDNATSSPEPTLVAEQSATTPPPPRGARRTSRRLLTPSPSPPPNVESNPRPIITTHPQQEDSTIIPAVSVNNHPSRPRVGAAPTPKKPVKATKTLDKAKSPPLQMKPPAKADHTPPKGKVTSSKAGDSKKRTPPPPTSPEMCDDVNPHKKPRTDKPGATLLTGPKGPNVLDKHLLSKTSLAEIFRNRVRDQHLQPLPPKAPVMPSTPPPPHKLETMKQRKHVRATNVMYMEQQEAFLRESIQRWTQVQQDMIKDVTSVVVL